MSKLWMRIAWWLAAALFWVMVGWLARDCALAWLGDDGGGDESQPAVVEVQQT